MSRGRTACLFAAWLAMIDAGQGVIIHHNWEAAATHEAEDAWPRESGLVPDTQQPTLVMFVHPHCPCTRASLAELTAILTQCNGKIACRLVFVRPAEVAADWEQTDLWRTAKRLPGVDVVLDSTGDQARRFGAQTSGECFLYDARGRLLFHGGITQSRGHEGDNSGRQAIISLVEGRIAESNRTEVYGCALLDREAR
jgi:hypothetical protein